MGGNLVRLDWAFSSSQVVGAAGGVTPQGLQGLETELAAVHRQLDEQRQSGKLGFWGLPQQGPEQLEPILQEAERVKSLADTLVVLGIGGSALGATAVDMALAGSLRHAFPRPQGACRLLVADNSDPRAFAALLENLDLKRTVFNVISKSGSTAETMSQFLVAQERLERELGPQEAYRRLLFTTDPQSGYLRALAAKEPFTCLEVPPSVGGRYSVLTAVGLLPLAAAGYDIEALLAGAASMAARCLEPKLQDNPAYLLAALAVSHMRAGRNILVMMPYASDLFGLAQWFAQLWAESLGKARDLAGNLVNVGQTPVAAVGATDQHSQLQLYMEGPQDKFICFLTLDNYGADLLIPSRYQDQAALAYLGGRSMAELIQAEAKATAAALAQEGRPSICLRLPGIDEHVLGELLFLLEAATVAAGGLLKINPLDQPGVELGKVLTYGLMGRPGYEEQRARLEALEAGQGFLV